MFLRSIRSPALFAAVLCLASSAFAQGTYTSFDAPNSTATFAYLIDDNGNMSGWYNGTDGMQHGFYRPAGGAAVTLDPAGSTYTEP
jgi:streptogramin lyase